MDPDALGPYDQEFLADLYRTMLLIRRFEETVEELTDELPGGPHLYIGQEAVAAGTCAALEAGDVIGSTHRGHGHMLARGADPTAMMAELGGKRTGTNRGRGGTMHLVDFSLGIFGLNGILGASVPHVVGGVLADRMDGGDAVGVAFFGDGAANEGIVPESLNLAAIWDVPAIFVCENNGYADTTPTEYAVAADSIAERARGYGVPAERIDGQDVIAVYEALSDSIAAARETGEPRFVECETSLFREHSAGVMSVLDRPYHTRDDDGRRDPIELLGGAMDAAGVLGPEERRRIDEAIRAEIDEAVDLMRESDYPPADGALEDVYADAGYPDIPAPRYR